VNPGVGEETQDVIDRQIGDAEITIVIFWKRLGTPTQIGRAATVEEFHKAVRRWRRDKRREVLAYFKTARIEITDDLRQAEGVQKFRDEIRDYALYDEFRTTKEFEARVRKHLRKAVRDWAVHEITRARVSKTAAGADPNAAFVLGLRTLERGQRDDAESWLRIAAEGGNIGSMFELALILKRRGDRENARTWFSSAAEHEDAAAIYNMGLMLKEDDDLDQAEGWFRRAAELGDVAAMYNLGLLLRQTGDEDAAEQWLRRGAEGGDVQAMYNLGLLLRDRGQRDGAELWFRRGAEGGDPWAMRDLATYLAQADGGEEADEWRRRAAEHGAL
jgi:TPR repeat protein